MTVSLLHFAQDGDTSGFFPQLARWHDRSNFRMLFATLRPMEPRLQDYMRGQGVETFSCGSMARLHYVRGLLRLRRLLRERDVAILHTHLFDPSVVGMVAGLLAGTPLRVVTRHYSDYHTRIHKRWHVELDRLCTRLSHRVIAVSRHTAEHLVRVEHAPSAKVRVVLNGIDFDRAKVSDPEAPIRLRREFAPSGEHLLLIAARLHPEKGYEYLFRAIPVLRARLQQPLRLLVAGDGPMRLAYEAMVRDLGYGEVVRFLGFRADVSDLMAAADVFVLPSVAEAFGLALAEALHLGVPVVATRVGGIPEIVDDDVDGLLVPPADSDALAAALARILSDEPLSRRLAGAGREKVRARFDFKDMVAGYEAVYRESLSERPGTRA